MNRSTDHNPQTSNFPPPTPNKSKTKTQSTGDLLGLGDDGSVSVAGGGAGAGGVKRSRSFLTLPSPREPKVGCGAIVCFFWGGDVCVCDMVCVV